MDALFALLAVFEEFLEAWLGVEDGGAVRWESQACVVCLAVVGCALEAFEVVGHVAFVGGDEDGPDAGDEVPCKQRACLGEVVGEVAGGVSGRF